MLNKMLNTALRFPLNRNEDEFVIPERPEGALSLQPRRRQAMKTKIKMSPALLVKNQNI